MRAGKVISGSNMVDEKIRSGKLLLLSQDAAGTTARQLEEKALRQGISVFRLPLNKDQLGLAIGKGSRSALLITESGFAEGIKRLLEMEVRPCEQDPRLRVSQGSQRQKQGYTGDRPKDRT
jgi:ribosomal protein L7Ae-like RNA K-turn-binding protein